MGDVEAREGVGGAGVAADGEEAGITDAEGEDVEDVAGGLLVGVGGLIDEEMVRAGGLMGERFGLDGCAGRAYSGIVYGSLRGRR